MTDISAKPRLPRIVIEQTSDGYQMSCPSLGVTCKAATIEAGYAALTELISQSGTEHVQFRSLATPELLPLEATSSQPRSARSGTSYITMAILFILLAPVTLVAVSVLQDIQEIVGDIRTLTAPIGQSADNLPSQLRSGSIHLARLADTIDSLTPARQQELQQNLERISLKLAPLAKGLRPLFEAAGLATPQSNAAEQEKLPQATRN